MSVFRFEMSQKSHFGYNNSQNSQSVKNAVVVGGGGGATSEKKKEEEK
jgi:hypothetical protein